MDKLIRRNGIWVCLVIFGALSLTYCSDTTDKKSLTNTTTLSPPVPTPPILTPEAAIEFAKSIESVANSLRSAQQQANYEGWIYEAKHKENVHIWEVSIRSKGKIIPSYRCLVLVTEDGKLVGSEPECGFAK